MKMYGEGVGYRVGHTRMNHSSITSGRLRLSLTPIVFAAVMGIVLNCGENSGGTEVGRNASTSVGSGVIAQEYIEAVSVDLEYGVLAVPIYSEDLPDIPFFEPYLIRVHDLQSGIYQRLFRLPSATGEFLFRSPKVLSFSMLQGTDREESLTQSVYLLNYVTEDTPTVLLSANRKDSSWAWVANSYDLHLAESLLVYSERIGPELALAGKKDLMQVVVRRIQSDGRYPVAKIIFDAEAPSISADGKQILMERWIENAPNYYVSTLLVYDIEADSVGELRLPLRFSRTPRRFTKDGPIYYLAADSERWPYTNLRAHWPTTGRDTALTDVSPPDGIYRYIVTPDSIAYKVERYETPEVPKIRWEIAKLKQAK